MVSLFSNGNINQTKSSKDKLCSKLFETGMAYFPPWNTFYGRAPCPPESSNKESLAGSPDLETLKPRQVGFKSPTVFFKALVQ